MSHANSIEAAQRECGILQDGNDVLQVSKRIKESYAEILIFLARHLADDKTWPDLWHKVAADEQNNAKEIDFIAKLRRKKAISSVRVDLVAAEVTLLYLQSFSEKIREAPPGLLDAVTLTMKLEERLAPFQLDNLVQFTDISYRNLFAHAIDADRERPLLLTKALSDLQDCQAPAEAPVAACGASCQG